MAWVVIVGVEPSMTQTDKDNNAQEFYNFFAPRGAGYTLEVISAILGNIDQESRVNPGCKETASDQNGWGLTQWTPATGLINWCVLHGWNWYDGYPQCEKLAEELEMPTAGQWIPTSQYPYTQDEFRRLTDIDLAVQAFCWEYERPLASAANIPYRIQQAHYYYQLLSGQPIPPTPPTPPTPSIFDEYLGAIAMFFGIIKRRRRW